MAYGDVNYSIVNSGSTGASANTAHLLFGIYGGLSDINNSESVNIQLWSSNNARLGGDNTVTNDNGLKIDSNVADLPPIRAGTASTLHFANETLGTNASVSWFIWNRKPL